MPTKVHKLFALGGQSIGTSPSVPMLQINIQGWFPLGLTGLISLQSKGLSRVFSSTTIQTYQLILWLSAFFMVQLPHLYMPTGKTMKVTQPCPTLYNPVDYTVLGTLQARILELVAFPFSRGSTQPTDWTQVSRIAGGFFTSWATREAQDCWSG